MLKIFLPVLVWSQRHNWMNSSCVITLRKLWLVTATKYKYYKHHFFYFLCMLLEYTVGQQLIQFCTRQLARIVNLNIQFQGSTLTAARLPRTTKSFCESCSNKKNSETFHCEIQQRYFIGRKTQSKAASLNCFNLLITTFILGVISAE